MDFNKLVNVTPSQMHCHLTICCRIVQIKGKLTKQRCDLLSVDFFKPIAVTSTVILGQLTKMVRKITITTIKKLICFSLVVEGPS